jgi:hypothetical protein
MGGLILDTKAGLLKGGARGPVIIPGKPAESRMLQAMRYTDTDLQMPPTGKLSDTVISDFERWIAAGAPDSRVDAAAGTASPQPLKGMSIEDGRKWWSFQPVNELSPPKVNDTSWPRSKIDSFVLAKLDQKGLVPSPVADPRTLITRAYIDLVGLRPTYEEVEAFAKDSSPKAYEKLVNDLLASPHYGERWGRYWLDVARFGEDFAESPSWAHAWRYRDWVIEAMNRDVPYNQFVKLQLAADLIPGTARQDLRALGYMGTAPVYHKDFRLSKDVLYQFTADDWDERVDALSRGLLGLTVACARCHDHKFDPILQKDYYGLAGVFASTSISKRPVFDVDPQVEARFEWVEQRLFEANSIIGTLTKGGSTNPEESAQRVRKLKAEIRSLRAEMETFGERYPQIIQFLSKYWEHSLTAEVPGVGPQKSTAAVDPNVSIPAAGDEVKQRGPEISEEPFMNAVYDAALYVDGTDPFMTRMDNRPGEARDLPVFLHGSVVTPGEIVPRHFPTVLSKGDSAFKQGSGRLELADKIFTDAAPLSARVIVNRVWAWHFGKPLVATLSDFGTQGEKPTHPELLDDLAARFIAHGWSLKWLHREIMFSATYRQSSHPRADGKQLDEGNVLLWRMNPRRMDIEAFRDSILRTSGTLSDKLYGPSVELDEPGNTRRTVYAKVSRQNINTVLRLYDFPDAMMTSPGRDLTTTSLQQLFVMNSSFIQDQAAALAKIAEAEPDDMGKVRTLYRKILARDPSSREVDLALTDIGKASLTRFAHILLLTNEEIFWP